MSVSRPGHTAAITKTITTQRERIQSIGVDILHAAIQPIERVLFASLSLSFSLSLQCDSALIHAGLIHTSWRQWRRLHPCHLVIALVPLKCSSRNLLFPHRVPFTKEKMPWCPSKMKHSDLNTDNTTVANQHSFLNQTIGLCIQFLIPIIMHKTKSLWKFGLNWLSKVQENDERKTPLLHKFACF